MTEQRRREPNDPRTTWTRDFVEKVLERVHEELGAPREEAAGLSSGDWPLVEAASVLASFDPDLLNPLGGAGAPSAEASRRLLSHSQQITSGKDRGRWRLEPEVRRSALRRLQARGALDAAFATNPVSEADPLQDALQRCLLGAARSLEEQGLQELTSTLTVTGWLEGVVPDLPLPTEVQRRIAFEHLLLPLRHLVGDHFTGRQEELQELGAYVSSESLGRAGSEPLLIWGIGGIGKSTLLAKFVLSHAVSRGEPRFPFAYVDAHRPGILLDEPVTVLIEALRQIAAQSPSRFLELEAMSRRWEERLDDDAAAPTSDESVLNEARTTTTFSLRAQDHIIGEFSRIIAEIKSLDEPFLLILDTFEEIQYRSRDFAGAFVGFLGALQKETPGMHVIVAGRAPVEGARVKSWHLENLDRTTAIRLLRSLGIDDMDTARHIYDIVGGNPLTLRLAAEVGRRRFPGGEVEGFSSLSLRIEQSRHQGMLYDRILSHIHDSEVRRLAHPGFALRRITPELIQEVLARPCGIKLRDRNHATELFDKLAKETALASLEPDGSVTHRPDLRSVMLKLISQDKPDMVRSIHRRAARFYSLQPGIRDRAEEIYHRLALEEPASIVDARWKPGVEVYLQHAVAELPPRSHAYLAARLGIDVPPEILAHAGSRDWERNAATRARNLLRLGRPSDALAVLTERADRSGGSPLFLLEAHSRLRLRESAKALQVLDEGIRTIASGEHREMLKQQLLLRATVCEQMEDYGGALQSLDRLADLAEDNNDSLLLLTVALQRLRLQRILAGPAAGKAIQEEVARIVQAIPERDLAKKPALVRSLIGDVGDASQPVYNRAVKLTAKRVSHQRFRSAINEVRSAADLDDLGTEVLAAWAIATAVGQPEKYVEAHQLLLSALARGVERIPIISPLNTYYGSEVNILLLQPAYSEYLEVQRHRMGPGEERLPLHYPVAVQAGRGAFASGEHLVLFLPEDIGIPSLPSVTPVSMEFLSTWQSRFHASAPVLQKLGDGRVQAILAALAADEKALRSGCLAAIFAHEVGQASDALRDGTSALTDAPADRKSRIASNAFSDLAADTILASEVSEEVLLLTFMYHFFNLRYCKGYRPATIGAALTMVSPGIPDPDLLGGLLFCSAVVSQDGNSRQWLHIESLRSAAGEVFELVRQFRENAQRSERDLFVDLLAAPVPSALVDAIDATQFARASYLFRRSLGLAGPLNGPFRKLAAAVGE